VSVCPEARLGQRRLENFTISAETKVLDFCSSSRQTTQFLVEYSQDVTGLDTSPLFLQLAPEKCTISQLSRSFC
jgi:demethylmenaquinone methyltransferase/2-methoxy-6-polyprenyl-1,4-benzoquinol methylase